MERFAHPHLGRLIQPRHYSSIERTAESGISWAADNDAFANFNEERFLKMLDRLEGLPGCLFVAAPDVVGDGGGTRVRFPRWRREIKSRGLPVAIVMQDGMVPGNIPGGVDAVFIGGTTEWKLGPMAARIVAVAKKRGLWVHMGRVNSRKRIRYAASIGCDSVDGNSFSRYVDTHLQRGLDHTEEATRDYFVSRKSGEDITA